MTGSKLLAVTALLFSPMAAPRAPAGLIFLCRPDPPSAGQDLEVLFLGSAPQRVYYAVGDGDWVEADLERLGDRGVRFKIPRHRLRRGRNLYLIQRGLGGRYGHCVTIE